MRGRYERKRRNAELNARLEHQRALFVTICPRNLPTGPHIPDTFGQGFEITGRTNIIGQPIHPVFEPHVAHCRLCGKFIIREWDLVGVNDWELYPFFIQELP